MKLFTTDSTRIRSIKDASAVLPFFDRRYSGIRFNPFSTLAGNPNLNDATISMLKKMADDRSPMVRKTASLKLAGILPGYVSENFIEIITNGTKDAKLELLAVIAQRGRTGDETLLMVIMHGLRDKNESVRMQALAAADASGNKHLLPYVAERIDEKHYKVRLSVASTLYKIGGKDSTGHLIGMLADKNIDVAASARQHLKKIDYKLAEKAVGDEKFISLVRGMNDREPVRKLTVQKIGEESIRDGLPLLHRACSDRFREVRIEALKGIAVFSNPSSVEFVEKLLSDRSLNVRLQAVLTLESIGDERALIALEWGLDDKKDAVRKAAHNAIVRLKSAK